MLGQQNDDQEHDPGWRAIRMALIDLVDTQAAEIRDFPTTLLGSRIAERPEPRQFV
jgi:hypothetical protein